MNEPKRNNDSKANPQAQRIEDLLLYILNKVSEHGLINLSDYRQSTLLNRLSQYLQLLDISPENYIELLNSTPDEYIRLQQNLLVVVTEFFRDKDAFDSLNDQVLKRFVETPTVPRRIWVPGCATGEEAYSIAMTIYENFKSSYAQPKFKIFATDLSQASLKSASKGVYSESSLKHLPTSFKDKYFRGKDEKYVVQDYIRRHIVFSEHNLSIDPPFTKLDLISCRNVLIYFNKLVQERILSRLHFCLNLDAALFIGVNEDIADIGTAFEVLDKKAKIYRKTSNAETLDPSILALPTSKLKKTIIASSRVKPVNERINLLNKLIDPGVVVDRNFNLIEVFGNNSTIKPREGLTDLNVIKLVDEEISVQLQTCLLKSKRTQRDIYLDVSTKDYIYKLNVKYLDAVRRNEAFYISVTKDQNSNNFQDDSFLGQEESNAQFKELQLALRRKDQELSTAIEELSTTNEELMSSNEELVSSNEELQSINEELNSVNAELNTINFEYQEKLHDLTQANNDLINLHNVAKVGTVFIDTNREVRSFSPLLRKRFGMDETQIGHHAERLVYNFGIDLFEFQKALNVAIINGVSNEFEASDMEGNPYWLRLVPYLNEVGICEGAVISLTEISLLKQAQATSENNSRFAESLIAATPGINYIYDFAHGRTTISGNNFTKLLGYEFIENADGKKFLSNYMHKDDFLRLKEHNIRLQVSTEGEAVPFEYRIKHKNGQWLWLESQETVHKRDDDGEVLEILGIALDITARKRVEQKLQFNALHDSLTGLRNRFALIEHLEQTHKDFLRFPEQNYAVLFIDLDKFKEVNDTFGHGAGDHVLKTTSDRIVSAVRNTDIVSRYSGDEFVVILKSVSGEYDSRILAEKILNAITQNISYEDANFQVSASIGIAVANPTYENPSFVINSADLAMYKSKRTLDKKIHIFNDVLHLNTVHENTIEDNLREAISKNIIQAHYQPIIDLKTDKIIGAEALARWPRNNGFIAAYEFIPIAEKSQMISKIDELIFRQSVEFLKKVKDKSFKIHINIAAKQLAHPALLEYLFEDDINCKQICIEITESQILSNNSKSIEMLEAIRSRGYSIAIDDFGTGYSSLSHLMSLPATILKIDKEFILNLNSNDKSREITSAILMLSKSLDYQVVAEGIENEEQLEFVKSRNCDQAQGYYFSKAVPGKEILSLLS